MKSNKDLLKRYLEGSCSEEEQKEALKLLAADDADQWLDELADEAWLEASAADPAPGINSDQLYKNIKKEVYLPAADAKHYSIKPWLYAACISLVLMFTFYFIQRQSANIPGPVVPEMVVKSTPAGMKSTIQLSDGSKVTLNSGSKISYLKTFTDSSRVITLEGEAFFEVAKDKTRPFSVIANGTTTTALGTSFNINARDQVCKVSLASGKVIVIPQKDDTGVEKTFVLSPGEALEVNTVTRTAMKTVFDQNKDLLWKEGVLYFKQTSIKQIINTLELWYDVEFEITGKFDLNRKYTGRFENASLTHVLDNMSYALDFEYLIQGKKVMIIRQDN
ncbi:putative anti sigma factor [Fulvivirga imtechensis AK7]|uniref:Putative anti sigma factor n=1 Tax=Fulvivirga imtechensis AK7 TaxID=1237149 RepID=L8JT17_9BACT|nr:FecR family protein [Fulvivirga imtechensis]ELR70502.1 putative anti sigma factor [Fulvivirga imtechensis AK7]